MAPRKKFLLIYTSDPPAADVVREDFVTGDVGSLNVGSECTFRWEKTKGQYEEIAGKVLLIGMKKDMAAAKVDMHGEIVGDAGVGIGTKKQEVEKRRMQQVNAQAGNLQNVAEILQVDGADAAADQLLHPVVKVRRPCLPKKRSPAILEKLQEMVNAMSCFSPGSNKVELCSGSGIYCDSGKLTIARLKYRSRPDYLHRALLKLTIEEKILRLEGISATGKRGCVGIPSIISETVALYVCSVFKKSGGEVASIKYNPTNILTNLIDNTRRDLGIWRIVCPTETADQEPENILPARLTPSPPTTPQNDIPSSLTRSSTNTPPSHTSNDTASPHPDIISSPASDHSYIDISFNRVPIAQTEMVVPFSRM